MQILHTANLQRRKGRKVTWANLAPLRPRLDLLPQNQEEREKERGVRGKFYLLKVNLDAELQGKELCSNSILHDTSLKHVRNRNVLGYCHLNEASKGITERGKDIFP